MDLKELKRGEKPLIRGCFLFSGAGDESAEAALTDDRCVLLSVPAGTVLSEVCDYRRSLGLVLSGSVRVDKVSDREYLMTDLKKGGLFGAASLYDEPGETPLVTRLTARTDVRIVFFRGDLLRELMRADFLITENYIRFLTGRIKFLNDKIQRLIYTSADTALAHYLLEHAGDGGTISPNLSALADELAIARASLYRSLRTLEENGCLKKSGRKITILDREALAAFAAKEEQK
jgi:CRP-like cAMP-binding protein